MIQGFVNTVQQDFFCIKDYFMSDVDTPEVNKVKNAAIRLFMTLGMAYSIGLGIKSFTAEAAVEGILKLASAVAIYILTHDIFVISRNCESDDVALAKVAPEAEVYTEGTLCPSLWNMYFAKTT